LHVATFGDMFRAHRCVAGAALPLTAVLLTATLAACGSSTPSSSGSTHGTASVACAGSLLKLYENTLGPAFEKATGDSFGGPPCAGSLALASEILAGEISPGVFLSIGAKAIKALFPKGRAKFALSIAADPLVIGYSSKSRYFAELNAIRTGSKPLSDLFSLFATPGFRLGRTDPTQDPQGIFFILMTELAQKTLGLPPREAARDLGITAKSPYGSKSQMLDEDVLPTDIAEGIVDAGSEYLPEAKQYGLDYITLPPALDFATPADSSLYGSVSLDVAGTSQPGEVITLDVALVSPQSGTTTSAADEGADQAFVSYLLSPAARAVLQRVGYHLVPPVIHLAPGVASPARALPAAVLARYDDLGGSVSTS
jgi:molybdate/tungstate transport system substrate-binding protein